MFAVLQAGDANQDLYIDQADFIQAFESGKYFKDEPATWSEGDWNGAPGGTVGQPPVGDGHFDLGDIANVNTRLYRNGAYDLTAGQAVDSLEPLVAGNVGELSLRYNQLQRLLTIDTHSRPLSTFHLSSAKGIFTSHHAGAVDSLGELFGVSTAHDVFAINAREGIQSITIRLNERYTREELLADLRVDGTWKDARETRIEYDPATGTLVVANQTGSLSAFELISATGQLQPQSVDPQLFSGLFDVRSNEKLFKLLPSGFAGNGTPLILEGALPKGWTRSQLEADLKISGALRPSGSIGYELVVKGEPVSDVPSRALGKVKIDCTCFEGSGTIGGRVFLDANRNGVFDEGERPFTGWNVQLHSFTESSLSSTTKSTMDVSGNGSIEPAEEGVFQFTHLPVGEYEVTVSPGSSYEFASLGGNTIRVNLQADQQITEQWFAATPLPPPLQAGDANQDRYIDEADLILALKAGKFATRLPATWAQGDWNGAPGGGVGRPPAGDGRFDANDLYAINRDLYRRGKYQADAGEAKNELQPLVTDGTGDVTVTYNQFLKKLTVTPRNGRLSSFHLNSTRSVFAGSDFYYNDVFAQYFSVNSPTDVFLMHGSYNGTGTFTIDTTDRFNGAELLASLRVDGSWMPDGTTQFEYDPETGSLKIYQPISSLSYVVLRSSSGQFRLDHIDRTQFSQSLDVLSTNHIQKWHMQNDGNGFATMGAPLELDRVLPPGLSLDSLRRDLNIQTYVYGIPDKVNLRLKGDPIAGRQAGPLGNVNFVCECGAGAGSIRGTVFDDTNQNGKHDVGEQGFNGWKVQLQSVDRGVVMENILSGVDLNQNGAIEPSEAGSYQFNDLPAGTYSVTVTPIRGYELAKPASGTIEVAVGLDQHITEPFAARKMTPAYLRGQVFHDLNHNGIRDAGELGLNGRLVVAGLSRALTINVDANRDGTIDPETEQGWYAMELVPETYLISAEMPAGWAATTTRQHVVGLQSNQTLDLHFGILQIPIGDLNGDFEVNTADIDTLFRAMRDWDFRRPSHDLNGDGKLNEKDLERLVNFFMGTSLGDVNLDRRFDSRDLIQVLQAGEYEDAHENNSTWAEGDWNGDGDFDALDLVLALQTGKYIETPVAAVAVERSIDGVQQMAIAVAALSAPGGWQDDELTEAESPVSQTSHDATDVALRRMSVPIRLSAVDQAIALQSWSDGGRSRFKELLDESSDDGSDVAGLDGLTPSL